MRGSPPASSSSANSRASDPRDSISVVCKCRFQACVSRRSDAEGFLFLHRRGSPGLPSSNWLRGPRSDSLMYSHDTPPSRAPPALAQSLPRSPHLSAHGASNHHGLSTPAKPRRGSPTSTKPRHGLPRPGGHLGSLPSSTNKKHQQQLARSIRPQASPQRHQDAVQARETRNNRTINHNNTQPAPP